MENLDGMSVFVRVVEAKSFSAAARRLGISKSVASKRVSKLEEHLGVRLLNRTTRRLSLTEEGRVFYERSARILAEVEDAELAVSSFHSEPRGTLRVNAPVSFGHLYLMSAIAEFAARCPQLAIDLTLNDRFVDIVDEGYDVVIRIANLLDSSLIARKLAPSRQAICASPMYIYQHGEPRLPADLKNHNCLSYSYLATANDWQFVDPVNGERFTVRVTGNVRVNNGDALRSALLEGLGIGSLPTFIVGEDIKAGRLKAVLPEHVFSYSSVYAIYPQNRHLTKKVRSFVDFLVHRYGPEPHWES